MDPSGKKINGEKMNTIPDYQSLMLPFLQIASDGKEHLFQESVEALSKEYSLTPEQRSTLLPSGTQPIFDNRVGWAKTYLKKACLIDYPKRGYFIITDRGRSVLSNKPEILNNKFLKQFDEFNEFQNRNIQNIEDNDHAEINNAIDQTPQELIDNGISQIENYVKIELLDRLKNVNPYHFEKVVLLLLKKMGYGEFVETPKSRDGGIDGIINEDQLGLSKIYIQAKRFSDSKVRETDIRNFIGAMSGDTEKGIFVTTSEYDEHAKTKAKDARHKIILVNGQKLVELMFKYGIGVQTKNIYEVKAVDNDFFDIENI